ncbi:MAG: hypothetical protein FJX25_04035 [Alphaproteobacteria bacterium]|nr:hypothetical protein [Alphaproteobacteria bacterium]
MFNEKLALSTSATGKKWLGQFTEPAEKKSAAALLDSLILLNEADIAEGIRAGVERLLESLPWPRRHIALYAEREFDSDLIYKSDLIANENGGYRHRAMRYEAAVKPIRGGKRVGSEGGVAYIISQMVENNKLLKNHPNPTNIRAKSSPVRTIVVVADLIGTGTRVCKMLDMFWRVKSVKSWVSLHYIKFSVVAAAGTPDGLAAVRNHRLKPEIFVERIIPTINRWPNQIIADEWRALMQKHGPQSGRGGVDRNGFLSNSALVAISSRIPNNTPAIIHKSAEKWKALYEGAAPLDLKWHFRLQTEDDVVMRAAEVRGVILSKDLDIQDKKLVLLLTLPYAILRGGKSEVIADNLGLPVRDTENIIEIAKNSALLTKGGRVTDAGQEILAANRRGAQTRPVAVGQKLPYYPTQLRVPRGGSSNASR